MSTGLAPAIELRSVTRAYPFGGASVQALRDVDVSIEAGETVCVVGPSGSGKSTLLHIMGCLDHPTSGEVRIAGERLDRLGDRARSRLRSEHIGFVFQGFSVVPVLTALENVEYQLVMRGTPAAARRRLAQELLDEVGLGGLWHRYPNRLSGGQLQRVAIARALAGAPDIVVADEPTANLDSATSREILALLRSANERRRSTLVVATHDPEVMRIAPRVVRLHDGRIESDGAGAMNEGALLGAREREVQAHGL